MRERDGDKERERALKEFVFGSFNGIHVSATGFRSAWRESEALPTSLGLITSYKTNWKPTAVTSRVCSLWSPTCARQINYKSSPLSFLNQHRKQDKTKFQPMFRFILLDFSCMMRCCCYHQHLCVDLYVHNKCIKVQLWLHQVWEFYLKPQTFTLHILWSHFVPDGVWSCFVPPSSNAFSINFNQLVKKRRANPSSSCSKRSFPTQHQLSSVSQPCPSCLICREPADRFLLIQSTSALTWGVELRIKQVFAWNTIRLDHIF